MQEHRSTEAGAASCAYRPCTKTFPEKHGRLYCSRRCKERAREGRHYVRRTSDQCAWCDAPLPPRDDRRGGGRMYCEDTGCAWAAAGRAARLAPSSYGKAQGLDLRLRDFSDDLSPYVTGPYRDALRADPCSYCGATGGDIDHIQPRHNGGSDSLENLTSTCTQCNQRKRTKPLLTWMLVASIHRDLDSGLRELAAVTGSKHMRFLPHQLS